MRGEEGRREEVLLFDVREGREEVGVRGLLEGGGQEGKRGELGENRVDFGAAEDLPVSKSS